MNTDHPTLPAPQWPARLARHLWRNHIEMWQHFARHWQVYGVLLAAAALASHYLALNFTRSVPERLVWLEHGALPARGDLVAFEFEGRGPAERFNGMRWLKRVAGVPGDQVTVVAREVFVNGVSMGHVAERSPRGTPLEPLAAGTIPPGHYFLGGSSHDSLDSRYSVVGLMRAQRIVARAHAIF